MANILVEPASLKRDLTVLILIWVWFHILININYIDMLSYIIIRT